MAAAAAAAAEDGENGEIEDQGAWTHTRIREDIFFVVTCIFDGRSYLSRVEFVSD